jgi:molybdenum cofactor biosynthesis enzyme
MECPRCGKHASPIDFTKSEALSAAQHGRTAAGHPVTAAMVAAWMGAKYLASQAYHCNSCSHQWRKWF